MGRTTEVTNATFQSMLDQEGIFVLDLWAAWCGPCRAFAPIFTAAAERHPDVTFGKVDTEAEPELARDLGVRAIPTFMVFRDGVLIFEHAGVLPGPAIDEVLSKTAALDMNEVRAAVEAEAKAGR